MKGCDNTQCVESEPEDKTKGIDQGSIETQKVESNRESVSIINKSQNIIEDSEQEYSYLRSNRREDNRRIPRILLVENRG